MKSPGVCYGNTIQNDQSRPNSSYQSSCAIYGNQIQDLDSRLHFIYDFKWILFPEITLVDVPNNRFWNCLWILFPGFDNQKFKPPWLTVKIGLKNSLTSSWQIWTYLQLSYFIITVRPTPYFKLSPIKNLFTCLNAKNHPAVRQSLLVLYEYSPFFFLPIGQFFQILYQDVLYRPLSPPSNFVRTKQIFSLCFSLKIKNLEKENYFIGPSLGPSLLWNASSSMTHFMTSSNYSSRSILFPDRNILLDIKWEKNTKKKI